MAVSLVPAIAQLDGRDNYSTWSFAVQAYLEHEGLWECVLGEDDNVDHLKKAKSKLILLIKPHNFVHITTCANAQQIWNKLKGAFEDSGLYRKVNLIRQMTNTRLDKCKNMEDYVNTIMSAAHKLNGVTGATVADEWIGIFLLAGLPESYRPMIMALESSGMAVTSDSIKTKLLQEKQSSPVGDSSKALYTSKQRYQQNKSADKSKLGSSNTSNKNRQCYACGSYDHISTHCPKKKNKGQSSNVNSTHTHNRSGFVAGLAVGSIDDNSWLIDSGAGFHMTPRSDWMSDRNVNNLIEEISVANDSKLKVNATGRCYVDIHEGGEAVTINDVLHVPELSVNLLSVAQMVDKGFTLIFNADGCRILDSSNNLFGTGRRENKLFVLNTMKCYGLSAASINDNESLWHRRMGHLNKQDLAKLKNAVSGINFVSSTDNGPCINCLKGKQTRSSFPKNGSRASTVLELIHSDLCGPMEEDSMGGARYFVTFIDDYTRKVFVYFLESKTNIRAIFADFKNMVENQTGNKIQHIQPRSARIVHDHPGNTIKILRTDNGTEYVNKDLENFLRQCGIRYQTTNVYTPEQNGLAERMNRTIVEKARCMLFDANLQKDFWAEAVNTAVYVVNRCPAKGLNGKTPEEVWSGKIPDLGHMKVFGCKAMVHVPKQTRKKWDAKSRELIFVGYGLETKGYRFIHPETKNLILSRDAAFFEAQVIDITNPNSQISLPVSSEQFLYLENGNEVSSTHRPVQQLVASDNEVGSNHRLVAQLADDINDPSGVVWCSDEPIAMNSDDNMVRRSERIPKPKHWDDYVTYVANDVLVDDPKTIEEAFSRPDAHLWKQAITEEYDSLLRNETFELVDLPMDRKAIACKWVFKSKRNSSGEVVRKKARLVIKGFSQRKGVDYKETFSPVVRYNSIRYLMSMAVQYDLDIDQMDAVCAFLQGEVDETIYMDQPPGFVNGSKVCKLKKALYGLKQASRQWNKTLDLALKQFGLKQSNVDPCVYFKVVGKQRTYLAVYVDDFIILSNHLDTRKILKSELSKRFQMKDLGEVQFCVGIRITRDRQNGIIHIDQERHILDLLAKFNMSDCKPVSTPCDINKKLTIEMCPVTLSEKQDMANIPYREAVGGLLYLSQGTRPDIAYTVNMLSKYNHNPGRQHWEAVKRVMRYLKGTFQAKIKFSKDGSGSIVSYTDSDWASDEDDRRSCTGHVLVKQGGAISWSSKRQPTVALSSTEAEYMALSSCTQETLFFRQLEFELDSSSSDSTRVYCDNKGAIDLSKSIGFNARTKHIDVRHHFLRKCIEDKQINVEHISTEEMLADFLTKPLSVLKHRFCSEGVGMVF